jgi:hypothetical protein
VVGSFPVILFSYNSSVPVVYVCAGSGNDVSLGTMARPHLTTEIGLSSTSNWEKGFE